jgi:hypothetical protein
MNKHIKYGKYIIRHKWYVFIECCKEGIPIRGLFHDMSKFLPSEWFPYANYFYNKPKSNIETGYYKPADTGDKKFDFAWLLHQKRNRHHWQWWLLPEDNGGVKTLRMPAKIVKEMLADWKGAGKAQGKPDTAKWYLENKHKMKLHPDTEFWIETKLGVNKRHET